MLSVPQRYRQTDGRTTNDSNTALALRASRGKNVVQLYVNCTIYFTIYFSIQGFQDEGKKIPGLIPIASHQLNYRAGCDMFSDIHLFTLGAI